MKPEGRRPKWFDGKYVRVIHDLKKNFYKIIYKNGKGHEFLGFLAEAKTEVLGTDCENRFSSIVEINEAAKKIDDLINARVKKALKRNAAIKPKRLGLLSKEGE